MFSKLLAYHTGTHTEVYTWRSGTLSAKAIFNADADGFARFAAYLKKHNGSPLYFLVDIVEENFRLDTIPHVLGQSRTTLIDRKLEQLFRNEPHRYAEIQGRTTEGRRDDQLLLSALTNNESINPWINIVLECKILLVGIYSVPLLSQEIIPKLGLGDLPHLLLLTRQNSAGLRQSYFQNGRLKFSRLVFVDSNNTDSLIQTINEESTKAQQYLSNQRLLPQDLPLEIHFLCRDNECRALLDGGSDTALRYQCTLHELSNVAAALKLRYLPTTDVATLLLQFLAHHRVKNQYASTFETNSWRLNQIKFSIKSSSIALFFLGALSTAYNIASIPNLAVRANQARNEAALLEAQTQAMEKSRPAGHAQSLPAEPDVLKGTVELVRDLIAHPRTPEALMTHISHALEEQPQIRLNHFQWTATASIEKKPPTGTATSDTDNSIFEETLLEGEVGPFIDDRDAQAAVEHLISKLREIHGMQVTPITQPIQPVLATPQTSLKGRISADLQPQVQSQPHLSNFSLKLKFRMTKP